ncbi:MAG: hypothetical protein ACO3B2_09520, partial [Vulcanococcus sp.]
MNRPVALQSCLGGMAPPDQIVRGARIETFRLPYWDFDGNGTVPATITARLATLIAVPVLEAIPRAITSTVSAPLASTLACSIATAIA